MGLIIDTSVIIAKEKGKLDFRKWQEHDEAYISSITVTELLVGVDRADTEDRRIKRLAFVEHIISSIGVLSFDVEAARIYAKVLHNLHKDKLTLGTHDMMIGSTAIAYGYPVLTMNAKDFKRIKGVIVLEVN